jgi:pentatricopeptide repeat protein
MQEFNVSPSSMTINKLIEGCIRNNELENAWNYYLEMKSLNIPCDNFT